MKIIKIDIGQVTKAEYNLGARNLTLYFIDLYREHDHYCEIKHGHNCDCSHQLYEKVTFSIRQNKKRVLVKGVWIQSEQRFTPSSTVQSSKMLKLITKESVTNAKIIQENADKVGDLANLEKVVLTL